jgi:hypothetical protein
MGAARRPPAICPSYQNGNFGIPAASKGPMVSAKRRGRRNLWGASVRRAIELATEPTLEERLAALEPLEPVAAVAVTPAR